MKPSHTHAYRTAGGITVHRASVDDDYVEHDRSVTALAAALDHRPGVLLSSSYDYPGRYSRWDIGCVAPPLRLAACERRITIEALNARGVVLLRALAARFAGEADYTDAEGDSQRLAFTVRAPEPVLLEEERSRQRSVFTALRQVQALFASDEDTHLGLYGAFGYELAFQFEPVRRHLARNAAARNLVLYLPDKLLLVDHKRERVQRLYYDFTFHDEDGEHSTRHLPREVTPGSFVPGTGQGGAIVCDHAAGAYAATVRTARQHFARGDLFEVVPGQTFSTPCHAMPSQVFQRLRQQNPAPYGALLNLGQQEYLVAASPEMYVRVEGQRVETCPISGTIARGGDALEDAERIRTLLNSAKDEAELSMCTDVDRNDKSRVCEPGSVRVLGRRQIELYSRLIHTVDHVEGILKPGCDALDAFLSHAWAVTVTGAPKQAAIQFLEDHELSPRRWYGGALGCLRFNGDLNTGLTLRTIHIERGLARVRAGATLLSDSDPDAEETETRLKASALLHVLAPAAQEYAPRVAHTAVPVLRSGQVMQDAPRVLMVDHQDSFVHTLSGYLQEAGAQVRTVRPAGVARILATGTVDLVVLSPGPGRPADFAVPDTLALCLARDMPVFGVCLGLQGIVEHFGGTLAQLPQPMHGKASLLCEVDGVLFEGLDGPLRVGRYHSLVAAKVPDCLRVCARSEDGAVMAVMHRQLPIAAVQFHPESILSLSAGSGRRVLANALRYLTGRRHRIPPRNVARVPRAHH